jgi:hypothetical protein
MIMEIMKEKGGSTFFYKDEEALKKGEWHEWRSNTSTQTWWSDVVELLVGICVPFLVFSLEWKEKISLKKKNRKSPKL